MNNDYEVVKEFLNKIQSANDKVISQSKNAAKRGSRMFDNKAIAIIRQLLESSSSSSSASKNSVEDL